MILPASYTNGFAPRDGQPLYPSLWRGPLFAAAPILGCTGGQLRDQGASKNVGAFTGLTAATAWDGTAGRMAIKFNATGGEYAAFTSIAGQRTDVDIYVSAWVNIPSTQTSFGMVASNRVSTGFSAYISSGKPYLEGGGSPGHTGVTDIRGTGWRNVGWEWRSSPNTTHLYVDGKLENSSTYTSINFPEATLRLGHGIGSNEPLRGSVCDFMVFPWLLSDAEKRILALRPGVAYELAPRRRASVQVAAFNRRRRLLIGAGS